MEGGARRSRAAGRDPVRDRDQQVGDGSRIAGQRRHSRPGADHRRARCRRHRRRLDRRRRARPGRRRPRPRSARKTDVAIRGIGAASIDATSSPRPAAPAEAASVAPVGLDSRHAARSPRGAHARRESRRRSPGPGRPDASSKRTSPPTPVRRPRAPSRAPIASFPSIRSAASSRSASPKARETRRTSSSPRRSK